MLRLFLLFVSFVLFFSGVYIRNYGMQPLEADAFMIAGLSCLSLWLLSTVSGSGECTSWSDQIATR